MTRTRRPVANTLRVHRDRLELGQQEVADRLAALAADDDEGPIGLDGHAVSRHELGLVYPGRRYRQLYGLLYGVEEEELWPRAGRSLAADPLLTASWNQGGTLKAYAALASEGEPVQRRKFLLLAGAALTAPAHQWLVHEPGRLAAALNGDRVTPALADRLPRMIAELRRMDDAHDPAVVLSLAERELAWVGGLLERGSYDQATGRALHRALAEIGQITGYMAFDAGDHVRAQRCYLGALRAAHTAGERLLGAHILKCMAEQAWELGRPQDALTLIDSALAGVRQRKAAGQLALLHSWRAIAHAVLDDRTACQSSIRAARTHADRHDDGQGPSWLYWLSSADITIKAGEALLVLQQFRAAEAMLSEGLATLPVDRHLGDQQVFLVRMAVAQVHNNDVEMGLHTADRVLDLALQRPSRRAADRIHELRSLLTPMAASRSVEAFLDRARQVAPAASSP